MNQALLKSLFCAFALTRGECVDYLHRVLSQLGEHLSGSYEIDLDDAMPFDEDNDRVPDRLQPQLED